MIDLLGFREPDGIAARATLIVVPGRGERPAVYKRFGARLANDAYRVYVLTDPTVDAGRTDQQLEHALQEPVGPVVLVGSDTGALFAAAAADDRVDGLILAGLPTQETSASPGTWEQELDARTTCPTHRGRISDELVTPGALYAPVPSDWFERAALSQIAQPILGLHGQEDPISAPELARAAYASAPAAELVTISGAPHDVLNDQTHRTVAATVVLWLERLRAGNGLAPIAQAELVGVNIV